jgi:hypothetical protein
LCLFSVSFLDSVSGLDSVWVRFWFQFSTLLSVSFLGWVLVSGLVSVLGLVLVFKLYFLFLFPVRFQFQVLCYSEF